MVGEYKSGLHSVCFNSYLVTYSYLSLSSLTKDNDIYLKPPLPGTRYLVAAFLNDSPAKCAYLTSDFTDQCTMKLPARYLPIRLQPLTGVIRSTRSLVRDNSGYILVRMSSS